MRTLGLASASLALSSNLLVGSLLVGCGEPGDPLPDAATSDAWIERGDAATVDEDAAVTPAPAVTVGGLGAVEGVRESGALSFYAIPYAEPPVGALRWRSPVPHAGWEGTLDGRTKPPACPQTALGLSGLGQEDCLYLNVHTPDPMPEGAPVLVWIHGGAFAFGEGVQTDRGTRGDLIAAAHGAIVVSMNYRLGALGFFANDAVGAGGNEGFEDQILALQWVHDHIADFGGDPARVTIAGESAGGISVCLHMIAPASRGLFQAVISQSGFCDDPIGDRERALSVSSRVGEALGCTPERGEAACLRAADLDTLRSLGSLDSLFSGDEEELAARWSPHVDGSVIPEPFRDAVTHDRAARVPVILGWTRDEGTLFIDLAERGGTVTDEAAYRALAAALGRAIGVEGSAVEAQYPLEDYADPGAAAAAMLGHAALACPSRRAAGLLAEAGYETYVYRFEYPDAPFQLTARPERPLGAFHSSEIQFVFGRSARLGRPSFNAEERALSDAMQGAWLRFAATGSPADASLAWPRYELASDEHVVFDRTIAVGTEADREACAFWDR